MRGQMLAAAAALAFGLAQSPALQTPALAASFDEQFPAERFEWREGLDPELTQFLETLDYKHGEIVLPQAEATLDVPADFYFLDAADARKVVEDAWGNPPDPSIIGMIFPADLTAFHEANWGAIITYEAIGYVSDEEAEGYDYDELLSVMQEDTEVANAERARLGYESVSLLGWAASPRYDKASRKLYWAKELNFGGADFNTLNYDIRALGRRGVLVTQFVAEMGQLPEIEAAIPSVLAMSRFNDGATYDDFDPGVDTVAAVGIGGLIAGKVLSKAGFFALALVFLKKFWFLALLPFVWLGRALFGRKGG